MLPAGTATEDTLAELLPLLSADDTLVDGGNAYYKDSMARARELSQRGLRYIDAGVSGGIHGLANGSRSCSPLSPSSDAPTSGRARYSLD